MKIPSNTPDSDLAQKKTRPTRSKTRAPKLSIHILKSPNGKHTRPETPLLQWNLNDDKVEHDEVEKSEPESCRRSFFGGTKVVSARKLAAGIWRLQSPEVVRKADDRLGFQRGLGHVGVPSACYRKSRQSESEAEDHVQSPCSVSGPRNAFLPKLDPSAFQLCNTAMERATKWDPICSNTDDDVHRLYGFAKPIEQQVSVVSLVSSLEAELKQAQTQIEDLETERKSSKRKIEKFLKKLSEERAEWRRREHEKVRAIIDDLKTDLNRERKIRHKIEMVNSKLVNELAETKLSTKRFMQEYEKERKERDLIEEVCDMLAKEIGDNKAEVEALKQDSMKLQEEVEDERRMLQMAEVWREERVKMKLVDAKVALEEKYSEMKSLIADLETFIRSKPATPDMKQIKEAEILQKIAASVSIHDITEFSYDPPNDSDDIFSILQEVNCGKVTEREIVPCVNQSPASRIHTVSPEISMFNKDHIQRHSNAYYHQDMDIEEDGSGWETVSQLEDHSSSYSANGSAPSVNRICRENNVSESGTDWDEDYNAGEETIITDVNEVCLIRSRQMKKSSSISRLWRTCPNSGENYKIISVDGINHERLSNGSIHSSDLVDQWTSPVSRYPHMNRGMKGCIEWPLGAQKNSLKSRLLEARVQSQKVQLRQVLKQKI